MTTKPPKPRDTGRVAFIAMLPAIKAEIARGEYLVRIHKRYVEQLGITYSAFRKLVQRYADDAKPRSRKPYGSGAASPAAPPASRPAALPPVITQGASNARHEPAAPRGFQHSSVLPEGQAEQLFGPGVTKRPK